MNYYEVLEIDISASQKEIHKAYIYLAKKNHPDMNFNDKNALKKMQEINMAYETLSDIEKRAAYDKTIKVNKGQEEVHRKRSDEERHKEAQRQKNEEDYQKEAKNIWEKVNKYYEESNADCMQGKSSDETTNRKHKFPFYFSMWFIWVICFSYLPYSVCVSFILTLGRYTELEKENQTQKNATNISVLLLLGIGVIYWMGHYYKVKIITVCAT